MRTIRHSGNWDCFGSGCALTSGAHRHALDAGSTFRATEEELLHEFSRGPGRGEALAEGRGQKTVVQRHELESRWTGFRHEESRGELERIRGPEIVDTEEPLRRLAHFIAGFDLVPARPQGAQARERLGDDILTQAPEALPARDG